MLSSLSVQRFRDMLVTALRSPWFKSYLSYMVVGFVLALFGLVWRLVVGLGVDGWVPLTASLLAGLATGEWVWRRICPWVSTWGLAFATPASVTDAIVRIATQEPETVGSLYFLRLRTAMAAAATITLLVVPNKRAQSSAGTETQIVWVTR